MTAEVQENKEQEFPWQLSDSNLSSYVDESSEYTQINKQLSWFNFNLDKPQETEQEIQERNVAIQQQIQLGILKNIALPQQQASPRKNDNLQAPQQALPSEIIESMQIRVFPPIITMLNGKDVDLNGPQPELNPTIVAQTQQPVVATTPIIMQNITNKSIADDFINKAEKYKFNLKGKKIGKNDPCPCGSGNKFKNCHGR